MCSMLAPGVNNHLAFFVEEVGGQRWLPPSPPRRLGGGAPQPVPLGQGVPGEAVPWPRTQGHVGIHVPAGTILVVRRGMYGGVARYPLELEGLAQGVEWWQFENRAAVPDFVLLQRMKLELDKPKKESREGMRPCHEL